MRQFVGLGQFNSYSPPAEAPKAATVEVTLVGGPPHYNNTKCTLSADAKELLLDAPLAKFSHEGIAASTQRQYVYERAQHVANVFIFTGVRTP